MAGAAGAGADPGVEALAEALMALAPGGEPAEGVPRDNVGEAEARLAALEAELKGAEDLAAQKRVEVAEAKRHLDLLRKKQDPAWRDWGNTFAEGLPVEVLAKVAGKLVAQTEAGWAAYHKERGVSEEEIQNQMADRKRKGNCLFVFARVCKEWRKAQLRVGGPLRTRVSSDVAMPGGVALAKWALAEGCPREHEGYYYTTMAHVAAGFGHEELVRCLIQEQGFAMDRTVMAMAARGGNLELVRWLRGEGCGWDVSACWSAASAGRLGVLQWLRANGCPWNADTCKWAALGGQLETLCWARVNGCDWDAGSCSCAAQKGRLEILQWLRTNGCPWDKWTCHNAVASGHVEVLRWARENGCPWDTWVRDDAAEKLGYTDDFGNLQ